MIATCSELNTQQLDVSCTQMSGPPSRTKGIGFAIQLPPARRLHHTGERSGIRCAHQNLPLYIKTMNLIQPETRHWEMMCMAARQTSVASPRGAPRSHLRLM